MTDANTALEEALKAVLEGADALESLLQAAENGASPQAAQEAGRRLYNYTLSLPEEHGRVAELKHAAARLLFADGTADTTSGLRQQLVVATRAAHCCSTAGLEDRASSGWKYAEAAWRALSRRGAATACAVDGVRLHAWHAEALVASGKNAEGHTAMAAAALLLQTASHLAMPVAETCYNIGVKCLDEENAAEALAWLEQAHDILLQSKSHGEAADSQSTTPDLAASTLQQRLLRCMAWALLSCGRAKEALERLGMLMTATESDQDKLLNACLYLEILSAGSETSAQSLAAALDVIVASPTPPSSSILTRALLVASRTRQAKTSPELQTRLVAALQICGPNPLAQVLTAFMGATAAGTLPPALLQQLLEGVDAKVLRSASTEDREQLIVAAHAAGNAFVKAQQPTDALELCRWCQTMQESNVFAPAAIAKNRVHLAWCLLQLERFDEAAAAADAAAKASGRLELDDALRMGYVRFRAALAAGATDQAIQALMSFSIAEHGDHGTLGAGLLGVAFHAAYKAKSREVSSRALKELAMCDVPERELLLRCYASLLMKTAASCTDEAKGKAFYQDLAATLSQGVTLLCTDQALKSGGASERTWWSKSAWNAALVAGKKGFFEAASALFRASGQAAAGGTTQTEGNPKQLGSLMAAACEIAASPSGTLAFDAQQRCHEDLDIASRLSGITNDQLLLLKLLRFELLAQNSTVSDTDLSAVIEEIVACAQGVTLLDIAAGMALKSGRQAVAASILRRATSSSSPRSVDDLLPYLRCQHDLLHMALEDAAPAEAAQILGLTLAAVRHSQVAPDVALDDDLLWFACKAWNRGVELHAQRHRAEALQLCSLAMQLLPLLSEAPRAALSPKMSTTFALLTAARRTLGEA